MKNENINLEQLLQQFVNESEAREMANDIRQADRLFDQHPAPAVSEQALSRIQNSVQHQLQRRRHIISEIKWITSVAAIVIVTLIAGLYVIYSDTTQMESAPVAGYATYAPASTSTSWNILSESDDNQAIEKIENELSSLAETIKKIESKDNKTYEPVNPIRYELMELEEIESLADSTDFWKG